MNLQSWQVVFLLLLSIWSIFWRGIALWRSAKENQRNWFIVLLIVNTAGILEIVYLFGFAKKKLTFKELKSWLANILPFRPD